MRRLRSAANIFGYVLMIERKHVEMKWMVEGNPSLRVQYGVVFGTMYLF